MARAEARVVGARRRADREERHREILARLRRDGTVRVATLAKTFGVTTETARRDLDWLAEAGALARTYGGAAGRSLTDEPGIGQRSRVHAAERARIGAVAAMSVDAGDVLMIDCGSTTSHFANALAARNMRLIVVTNCLPVARALGTSANCRVILCPGDFVAREGGVYGPDTVEFLRRFRANKAYIGAGGLTPEAVTDADSLSCAVKRAMIERSERTILLVDSSKFGATQFEQVCAPDAIVALIADAAPPKRLAARLRAANVRVLVASE